MVVCLSRPSLPLTTTASSESQLVSPLVPFAHPYLSLPPPPSSPPLAYTVPGPQFGNTPLHWACLKGLTEVALALIEKGANVDAANNDVRPWGGVRVGGRADRQMSGMDGGVSQPPLAPPSLRRLRARANSYSSSTVRSPVPLSLSLSSLPLLPHRWHFRNPALSMATHRFSTPVLKVSLRWSWRSSRRAPTWTRRTR